ncbi:DUF1992 domain-containing protein [Heyndrickxia sporothermodurans]|uniref:DUF1992 domain-containing protein n=1 Tax=Heyndrickxia sporothermodurans TaxID=46224 RepID=A0A150KUA9_9BACI|nr:DUF1992 domain-containing protein [Heyndrickxia sporothermodurans]KYD03514.1 hypothetical protein B4102_3364 [Heyndrickxia sporothermodurans]MBL5768055.1 DUF1992 domain-containing protein [Heyndrickxia sporothermodurans]MBL5771649.1 DUF1992 domain-containing protein [Heyndrickxia sporothermodurans]MBL5775263.1 DUF1992 domain-containing protein [Heyndrickxia sporothermodurans]MBL5778726.1 DUF1992 domain-containing protein [Heyndrickxia sporothermodurans]
MDFFRLTEDRIREAYKNGEFKNLPGYGKPLPDDELANIPEDLRMAYRIMRNAGFSPEEASVKKELMTIEDLIKQSKNELNKEELTHKLNEKMLKYNELVSKKGGKTNSSVFKNYEQKIEKKFLK